MKKLAMIAALMLAAGSANAQSWKTADVICLSIARLGEASAMARANHVAESELLKISREGSNKTDHERYATAAAEMVVPFVYTMKLAPDHARQLVYLKCKGGEYAQMRTDK